MNFAEIVAMITNLGVATAYSVILLYFVIKKISRILEEISNTLRLVREDIQRQQEMMEEHREALREVRTLLYIRGGRHETLP